VSAPVVLALAAAGDDASARVRPRAWRQKKRELIPAGAFTFDRGRSLRGEEEQK